MTKTPSRRHKCTDFRTVFVEVACINFQTLSILLHLDDKKGSFDFFIIYQYETKLLLRTPLEACF